MMTARTAGSRFQSLSCAVISARIGVSQALSFHGLLSVIVPIPPVMSVKTASLMGRSFGAGAYRRARSEAVKCTIERCVMFGKHVPECGGHNHDWQAGARDCAGRAGAAHAHRRR